MFDGRSRSLWVHTSNQMALLANVHRDPKRKSSPYTANDFSPHPAPKARPLAKVKISSLKETLMGRGRVEKTKRPPR